MLRRMIRMITALLFALILSGSAISILMTDVQIPEEKIIQTEEAAEIITSAASLKTADEIHVTILGDSIAKGYSKDKNVTVTPYGNLVMDQLAAEGNFSYNIVNYAKNGLDSVKMNSEILTDDQVCESLRSSDVIFITVGSNDLLNTFKKEVQEILQTNQKFRGVQDALDVLGTSVLDNPLLILRIIEAIQEWDYLAFEAQWIQMMDTINELKKDDAWIVVTNIYNPVSSLELPSMMNQVVENVIINMNDIIGSHAEEYGYRVADVFHSEVYEHVQEDGLHPDQVGQQIIADRVLYYGAVLNQG